MAEGKERRQREIMQQTTESTATILGRKLWLKRLRRRRRRRWQWRQRFTAAAADGDGKWCRHSELKLIQIVFFRFAKMNFLILISEKTATTFGFALLGKIFTFSLCSTWKIINRQQSHTIPIHTQTQRHRQWHWNCHSVIATLLFSFIALIVFDWMWVFILMRLIQWAWNVRWALLHQTFLQLRLLSFDRGRRLMPREKESEPASEAIPSNINILLSSNKSIDNFIVEKTWHVIEEIFLFDLLLLMSHNRILFIERHFEIHFHPQCVVIRFVGFWSTKFALSSLVAWISIRLWYFRTSDQIEPNWLLCLAEQRTNNRCAVFLFLSHCTWHFTNSIEIYSRSVCTHFMHLISRYCLQESLR